MEQEQATLLGTQAGSGGSVYTWLGREEEEEMDGPGLFRSFGGEQGKVS